MTVSGTLAVVCDDPAALTHRLNLARHLAEAGATVWILPVACACPETLPAGVTSVAPVPGEMLADTLANLDRRQPLDAIDLPGGPLGLRLVQARRAGLALQRARLIVHQGEPAALERTRRHQWIVDPWQPIQEYAERLVFESADVPLFEAPGLAGTLRELGWTVAPTARLAPPASQAGAFYAEVLARPRSRAVSIRWPLVSIVAPAGTPSPALLDALQAQTYPHLEFVPSRSEVRGGYVLFPTPDSRPTPGMIEALVAVLERHPESAAVVPATRWLTPHGEVVVVPTGGPRWLAGLPCVFGPTPALCRQAALVGLADDPLTALLAQGRRVEVHPEPLVVRRTDGDPLAVPRDFPLLPLASLSPAERHDLWSMLTALVLTDYHPLAERERLCEEETRLRAELSGWPHRVLDWLDPVFRLVPRRAKEFVRAALRRVRGWLRRPA